MLQTHRHLSPRPWQRRLADFRRCVGALSASGLRQWALRQDSCLIAGSDAPTAAPTQTQVVDLFLGRWLANVPLAPVDQDDIGLRKEFYRAVADLSLQSARADWAKRVSTGRGWLPACVAADQVLEALGRDPGTVTYLPTSTLPKDTKVLLILNTGDTK